MTDNPTRVVGAYRADLDTLPCPAGSTGVTQAAIRAVYAGAIYQGGKWDGTAYTLPASQQPPTTIPGMMRKACRETDEKLLGMIREIRGEWRRAYPAAVWGPAIGSLIQIRKGVRGIALQTVNPLWTPTVRLDFIRASADAGGTMGKAEDVLTEFFNAWEAGTPLTVPQGRRLVWANPSTAAAIGSFADDVFDPDANYDVAMVADATDQSVWSRAGAWCREIQ